MLTYDFSESQDGKGACDRKIGKTGVDENVPWHDTCIASVSHVKFSFF